MFGTGRVTNNWLWTMAHVIHLSLLLNCAGLEFNRESKSWIDALEQCQNNNSSLVEIRNDSVQNAVNCLLREKKKEDRPHGVWIGLEHPIFGCDVKWVWTSGPEVGPFSQWSDTHPVDPFNNHCGKIIEVQIGNPQEFKWLDANCHDELPFICQSPGTIDDSCTKDPT